MGGPRPPDIVSVNPYQPSEFRFFFPCQFLFDFGNDLGAVWELKWLPKSSPNPSETCPETDFEKSSISDPILGRFFIDL